MIRGAQVQAGPMLRLVGATQLGVEWWTLTSGLNVTLTAG